MITENINEQLCEELFGEIELVEDTQNDDLSLRYSCSPTC